MPWDEALTRAGSLDALRPHLSAGSILARHSGLYSWPKGGAVRGPANISPGLWAEARIDPASERVIFTTVLFFVAESDSPPVTGERFAIGIELERAAVEKLFPVAPEASPRHAGGRDPDNDWEGAARHVDDWVAAHGPLPRHKDGSPNKARAVELMTEWFEDNQPPAPQRESFYRWLRKNPHPAWWR
jgi:hypothetical protein